MNKKIILATVATIAAIATAQGVKADEVQGTTTSGNGASTVTAPIAGTTGAEKMKQRRLINNQLLKIQMQKQEAKAKIQTNRELLRSLASMTISFK